MNKKNSKSFENLLIVDIRSKQKKINIEKYVLRNTCVLSLNPYSSFLLSNENIDFIKFHDLISLSEFREKVFREYTKTEEVFKSFDDFSFLFRDAAFFITYDVYVKELIDYIETVKKNKIKVHYISDKDSHEEKWVNSNFFSSNNLIDRFITVSCQDKGFYFFNSWLEKINRVRHTRNVLKRLISRYFTKKDMCLPSDMANFNDYFYKMGKITARKKIDEGVINNLAKELDKVFVDNIFSSELKKIIERIKSNLKKSDEITGKIKPFSFLSNTKKYVEFLVNKENNIPNIFIQHGSYLQENIFLRYNEIYPASLNLVLNDFTKELFEKRGAKRVHAIGSIKFNYAIVENRKKYDYLYITYCTSYNYAGTYIGNKEINVSADADNIYERHKKVIELFGTRFKEKKICIKIQPGIMTGAMLYVPLMELSKKYSNVTIEFSTPIQKIISHSKYIISDYFSSEFINREIHYKRDIILFKGAPTRMPQEIIEDMNKMFILVETIQDLEHKVERIKDISMNRVRHRDIIEYYSSKDCDTKRIVPRILDEVIHG
jgi:hypothetical protein